MRELQETLEGLCLGCVRALGVWCGVQQVGTRPGPFPLHGKMGLLVHLEVTEYVERSSAYTH